MHLADAQHPGWSFAEHVGYSTPSHREAILRQGVSPLHRMSFQSLAYQQLARWRSTTRAAAACATTHASTWSRRSSRPRRSTITPIASKRIVRRCRSHVARVAAATRRASRRRRARWRDAATPAAACSGRPGRRAAERARRVLTSTNASVRPSKTIRSISPVAGTHVARERREAEAIEVRGGELLAEAPERTSRVLIGCAQRGLTTARAGGTPGAWPGSAHKGNARPAGVTRGSSVCRFSSLRVSNVCPQRARRRGLPTRGAGRAVPRRGHCSDEPSARALRAAPGLSSVGSDDTGSVVTMILGMGDPPVIDLTGVSDRGRTASTRDSPGLEAHASGREVQLQR